VIAISVMITGGTGFIGSYVARKLVELNYEVILVDISPRFDLIKDIIKKVKVVRCDISDIIDLLTNVKKYNVEYIIHLAYLHLVESQEKPWKALKVNCGGLINVFEAAKNMDVKRVVYVNSIAAYGTAEYYGEKPINEDTPLRPTTVYGACRAFDTFMGQYYYDKYGLDVVGVRPGGIVYGLGMVVHSWFRDLIEKSFRGEPVKVPYSDQKVDWQYVKDTANALILALDAKNLKHRIFNTCGEVRTVREAVKCVKQLIPGAIIEVDKNKKIEPYFPYLFDITRAREELGFEPQYTLEQGIKDYIDMLRERKGEISV